MGSHTERPTWKGVEWDWPTGGGKACNIEDRSDDYREGQRTRRSRDSCRDEEE